MPCREQRLRLTGALLPVLLAAVSAQAGSLSGPVLDSGLTAVVEDFIQLPASAALPPFARLNVLAEAPDGTGRLFVNDMRGLLYVIEDGVASTYLDFAAEIPALITSPGLGTGFVSFAFHPDFAVNGLFYTVHSEAAGATPPNLGPAVPAAVYDHEVLTEWAAADPAANAFAGTHRELMRISTLHAFHSLGEIAFDPGAGPGDEEYGLLHLGGGDYGSVSVGAPEQLQRLDTPYGTVLRIDPTGGPFVRDGTVYPYGIPASNPFADDGDPDTLGEIFAYGFRNAHRIAWDPAGDGIPFVSDIGQGNLEEIDRLLPGANYGWPVREGSFALDVAVDTETVFPLPAGDELLGFTYPVAQYDHEEGQAIAGGFVYRGQATNALHGQFVFGDIVSGRLLYTDADEMLAADDGDPATTADVHELHLRYQGQPAALIDVVSGALGVAAYRTDLRFGQDAGGAIYLMTKQDGFIRRLLPQPACSDGVDNDGDSLVDLADPGCPLSNPAASSEDPGCQDGADNDGDGRIDFDGGASIFGFAVAEPDSHCLGAPWRKSEKAQGCGLGAELVPALWALLGLRRRKSR